MSISIDQVGILALLWVFCFFEDIWFDRLLRYQISGRAEKLNISPKDALAIFNAKRRGYVWPALSLGLCFIIVSLSNDFASYVGWPMIVVGTGLCVLYFLLKLSPYLSASSAMDRII